MENQVTCNAHALKNKTMEVEICSLQVQGGVRIFTRGLGTVGIKKPGPNLDIRCGIQRISTQTAYRNDKQTRGARYSTAFIYMEVNDVKCYGQVDSGASVSLCSKNILRPAYKLYTSKITKVRGVSGNYLNVLVNTNISCKIGEFPFHLTNITVVEEMADCVFIIGRDILEPHNCIINYRDLTLQIDEHKFPSIKVYQGKHLKRPVAVHSSSTYNIPAHSSSIISCHLRSRQQGKNPKLYLTTSGAFEPCPTYNHKSIVPNCLININRGKSHILIYNKSDHSLCIYKHNKVGNLETFHCSELSALNSVVGRHTTTPSPPLQPRHDNSPKNASAMPDSQVNSIKDEISDISDRITKLCKNHEMHNPMVNNINTLSNAPTARVNLKHI